MFAPYRLVAVFDADGFIRAHHRKLAEYCKEPSSSASLLLVSKSFPKTTQFYKTVNSMGGAIECKPTRADVTRWIQSRAKQQYDKSIDKGAAESLHHLIGDDLATLDQELAKLSTYVGRRETIVLEDVSALVGMHRHEVIFGLARACVRGDADKALQLWDRVWMTNREAPFVAIGGLSWALRRDLTSKCHEGNPWALKKAYWGWPAEEIRDHLSRWSLEEFEQALCDLSETDLDVKTGLTETRLGVEKFIIKQCMK